MTQQRRDIRVTTGYKVDTQSVKQAVDANKNVAASYMAANDAVKHLGADILALNPQLAQLAAQEQGAATATQRLAQTQTLVASSATQTTAALARQRTPVQDLTALYASLEQQERKTADAAFAVGNAQSSVRGGIGGSGIASGFGTLRSLSGAAGLIAGNTQAGSTIAAFAGLTSVLGPAGIGAAVLALGLRAVSDWQERATQTGKDYVAVLERISGAIAGGATTQDINQQIKQLETEQQVARESAVEIERIRHSFTSLINNVTFGTDEYTHVLGLLNADLYNATGGTAGLKDGLGSVGIGMDVLNGILKAGEGKINAASAAIAFLNVMRGTEAVAANTAAEALRKLSDMQVDAAQRTLELDKTTRAERDKQIAQKQREIEILRHQINTYDLTIDATEQLSVQIGVLNRDILELKSVITSTADLYAREEQIRGNAKDTLEQLNDAMKREGEAREALAEISRKMAELDSETAAKRQAAQQDAEERRNEISADGAERRQEIELQDADRREEILNQFNRSYGDALGNRDALAAVKAKEQRDDELQKQDKANKRQLDQLDKQLDKQQRAVQLALEKQLRSIDDAYQKQQRTLQQAHDRARADLENALQAQRTLQAVYNQMIHNAEIMHQAAMYKTIYDYGEMARIAVENAFRSIANTISGSLNGVVGGPDSGVYPGASVGGNLLSQLERDRQAAVAKAYQDYYLRQGMPAQGYLANRMPAFPRGGGSAASMNLSGAPTRGSLPNVNVTVNTPLFDRTSVDKLWYGAGGIRQKIIEGLPR